MLPGIRFPADSFGNVYNSFIFFSKTLVFLHVNYPQVIKIHRKILTFYHSS